MTLKQKPVICLMGPTASGKTALACELYDLGRFELISVDSALVYRDMNIGTAKPSEQELSRYPHALINIIDPTDTYSAAEFVTDASAIIDQVHAKGKVPILVGGTMLYFKALMEGLSSGLPTANSKIRQLLYQQAETHGWESLYQKLQQVDPEAAIKFKLSDKQRILRALEVYEITGKPLTVVQQQTVTIKPTYQFDSIALFPERTWLHQRIEQRLQLMWQQGFIEEVIALRKRYDLTCDLPSMRCVGYRQVWQYLEKGDQHHNLQEMKDRSLFATRQLAKRQYTWLRSLQEVHEFKTFYSLKEAQQGLLKRYR